MLTFLVKSIDKNNAFAELRASNKDLANKWALVFWDIYHPTHGFGKNYYVPTAADHVSNLKSKIVDTLWPSMEAHCQAKRTQGEKLTWAEEMTLVHYKAYKANLRADKENKAAEASKQHKMGVIEDILNVGEKGAKNDNLNLGSGIVATASCVGVPQGTSGNFTPARTTPQESSSLFASLASAVTSYLTKQQNDTDSGSVRMQQQQPAPGADPISTPMQKKCSRRMERYHDQEKSLEESIKNTEDPEDLQFLCQKKRKLHEKMYGKADDDVIEIDDSEEEEN